MQRLTSTKIDTYFSSARFSNSNASDVPSARSTCGGHGREQRMSGFNATFSNTERDYAGSGATRERVRDSDAMSSTSMVTSRNEMSTASYPSKCGKPDQSADSNTKSAMSLIGSAMIDCVSKSNDFLNTPLISSVGKLFNLAGPCGRICHVLPDLAGYAVSKAVAGMGRALGGTGSPNYHFEHEWLSGSTSPARA
jgi:hypothetical protein